MTAEEKAWIDNASYAELLRLWRFAPAGHPMFFGDTGDYYSKIMAQKRDALPHSEQVQISKDLG